MSEANNHSSPCSISPKAHIPLRQTKTLTCTNKVGVIKFTTRRSLRLTIDNDTTLGESP